MRTPVRLVGSIALGCLAGSVGGCGSSHPRVAPLTAAQVAGQHFVYPFGGTEPPPDLVLRIRRGEAAGVILFSPNFRSERALADAIARLQGVPQPPGVRGPLLVMVDQEGGQVKRLPGPPSRSATDMGRTEPAVVRREGRATAAALHAAGVNVDLAPVADVGRPGSALVAEKRTFGGDPADVTAFAGAFAAGLNDGAIAATFKHFPGLGAASQDTDRSRVITPLPRATIRTVDERPFAAAKSSGARLVMVSTAIYPALSTLPAALSPAVVRTELRTVLGFRGVSVSDSLDTPAVAKYGSPEALALRALDAGIDLVLVSRSYRKAARAADAAQLAIARGQLDRARVAEGSRRVLRLRAELGRAR